MNTCRNCQHKFETQTGRFQVCPLCGEQIDIADEASAVKKDQASLSSVSDDDDDSVDDTFVTAGTSDDLQSEDSVGTVLPNQTDSLGDDEDEFELAEDIPTRPASSFYDPHENQPTIEMSDHRPAPTTQAYAEREINGLGEEENNADLADYIIAPLDTESVLGSGASGIVYKAKQKSLDRTVALKLLKKQIQVGSQSQVRNTIPKQEDIDKFLYESQITAGLDHPNVITVHDLGVTSNDTLFYSMKLFEGGKDWSKEFDQNSLEQNLDIFNDVCDAIRRAHRDRIIHRDLKPQNVLVGDFGEVQVTDWGLAIDLHREVGRDFAGGGTPCYMAPEMARHYLAQTDAKTLKTHLESLDSEDPECVRINDEIAKLKKREQHYRSLINERSDIYVLGAILFQIGAGYPPHLYQVNETLKQQWGRQTGRKKVRRELDLAADRTIAKYRVRDLADPEARLALTDIAMKAMATEPNERFADVAELQSEVRQFRKFMRCIEDTRRGDSEVETAAADPKSYVHLNNAIYAYQAALENYPDYKPAIEGHAHAKFLFADRALKNQDFELGLATMTEPAIAQQTNTNRARTLRQALLEQRKKRDRRKKLLVAATAASLASIAVGIIFAGIAIFAQREALRQTEIADNKKTEAQAAEKQTRLAQTKELDANEKLWQGLSTLKTAQQDTIELKVEAATSALDLEKLRLEKEVASLAAELAELKGKLEQLASDDEARLASLSTQLANTESELAELEKLEAQIASEATKERTQFNQYINRLKNIEDNIEEGLGRTQLAELFDADDISLEIKNGWEAHHLYKQAHPVPAAIQPSPLGHFKILESDGSGGVVVAVSDDNQIYRWSAMENRFVPIAELKIRDARINAIAISPSGRWLAVAQDSLAGRMETTTDSLPIIYDLQNDRQFRLGAEVQEQLRFKAEQQSLSDPTCKEKFYSNVQYVQILDDSADQFQLLMVDQRTRAGLNQLRCAVMDITPNATDLRVDVAKIKVAGKLFLRDPGLVTGTACLASALKTRDGSIFVAVANSQPKFAVSVFSFNDAALFQHERQAATGEDESLLQRMKRSQEILDTVTPDFVPTAMDLMLTESGSLQLFVGNGKGEIADLTYRAIQDDSFMLTAIQKRLMTPSSSRSTNMGSRLAASANRRMNVQHIAPQRVSSTASRGSHDVTQPAKSIPLHKSAVRQIQRMGNQLITASDSEILVWVEDQGRWNVSKKLFGQPGKIGAITHAKVDQQLALLSISNLPNGKTEFLTWNPSAKSQDPVIRLEKFKRTDLTAKQVVQGAADKSLDSNAIALAFDDGSFEIFHPEHGRTEIARPADFEADSSLDVMSPDDFRNGKFEYFPSSRELVMYSNSLGLMTWQLDREQPHIPLRPDQAALYRGAARNSRVQFSAAEDGQTIVTSHPHDRDKLVLWKRGPDGEFAPSILGPFRKSETSTGTQVEFSVHAALSPNGELLVAALRLRNTYQIQIFATQSSSDATPLAVIPGDNRTNLRALHFLNNQRIVFSKDQIESDGNRQMQLSQIEFDGNDWTEEPILLPQEVADDFNQVALVDAAIFDGQPTFVGFASERQLETVALETSATTCPETSTRRDLIVWTPQALLLKKKVTFNRRIAPRLHDGQLSYMSGESERETSQLITVDLNDLSTATRPLTTTLAGHSESARRWQNLDDQTIVYSSDDWFVFCDRAVGRNAHQLKYSLPNPAERIELSKSWLAVLHENKSLSLAKVSIDNRIEQQRRIRRLDGNFRHFALSPEGAYLAAVNATDGQIQIASPSDLFEDKPWGKGIAPMAPNGGTEVGLTWLRPSALQELGIVSEVPLLIAAEAIAQSVQLRFLNPTNGSEIEVSPALQNLPLNEAPTGKIKSFNIASATGSLAAIVWEGDRGNGADIWKFAPTEKPQEGEDPQLIRKEWFPIDDSSVGKVYSVHFSQALATNATPDQIATRIVIGSDNQGTKAFKLFAIELGSPLVFKPLLELFVADKLQTVDQMIGAEFTGDGKTLLTMTADNVQMRLSDGWQIAKQHVDFEDRIRQFQNEIAQKPPETLNRRMEELFRLRENFQINPERQQLLVAQRQKQAQLEIATQSFQETVRNLEQLKQSARQKLQAQMDQEILQLNQDMASTKNEIETLKKNLASAPE